MNSFVFCVSQSSFSRCQAVLHYDNFLKISTRANRLVSFYYMEFTIIQFPFNCFLYICQSLCLYMSQMWTVVMSVMKYQYEMKLTERVFIALIFFFERVHNFARISGLIFCYSSIFITVWN
jgi:hypothetical protein